MFDLPPPDPSIEIVLASRGMTKGLSQTDGPQLLVRPEIASGPLYLAAIFKNVDSATADGEAWLILGARHELGGFELTASATAKFGVGGRGHADRDSLEFQTSASRAFGPVTPRLSLTWSPDDLGGGGQSLFAEAGASLRLTRAATLSAGLGRRERAGAPDYTTFNLGGAYSFGRPLSVELRYYDNNRGGLGDQFHARLVGSVRLRF
jgi:hypothetical protein